jgi:hypothetical protein
MVDNPDNQTFSWRTLDQDDSKDTVLDVLVQTLGQVNDVLKAQKKGIYFSLVPSSSMGIEVCWHKEGE